MSLTREQMLAEMGIAPLWVRRDVSLVEAVEQIASQVDVLAEVVSDEPDHEKAVEHELPGRLPERPAWEPSGRADLVVDTAVDMAARADGIAKLAWGDLYADIRACRACGLCVQRQQAVPGDGDVEADWLLIGDGPGAQDAEHGEPFVGPAGQLLDAMLAAIDLKRGEDVYMTQAVKCMPPSTRAPNTGEVAICRPYLARQIALLQPKVIVLLGSAAAQAVLGEEATLASLRGQSLRYRNDEVDVPVVVTYHPADLLRSLPDKAKAWDDLCRARALVRAAKSLS